MLAFVSLGGWQETEEKAWDDAASKMKTAEQYGGAIHPSEARIVGKLDERGKPVPLAPEQLEPEILRIFPDYDNLGNPVR